MTIRERVILRKRGVIKKTCQFLAWNKVIRPLTKANCAILVVRVGLGEIFVFSFRNFMLFEEVEVVRIEVPNRCN